RYDAASDRLLTYGNACRPEIRSIDPLSGDEEILAAVPDDLAEAEIQVGAFDSVARRLYYLTELNGRHPRLVTFDVERRTFQAVPFPLSGVIAAFEFLDDRRDVDGRPGSEHRIP